MKILDRNLKIYLSISNNPSTRGSKFYNNLFQSKNINAIYLPVLVKSKKHFLSLINFIKSNLMNFSGISISMPFKNLVYDKIEKKHVSVKNSKNVNTIIVKKNIFFGFNTDYLAAKEILKQVKTNLIIFGSGGLAKSFVASSLNKKKYIINRSIANAIKLRRNFKKVFILKNFLDFKKLGHQNNSNYTIIITSPKINLKKLLYLSKYLNVVYICNCILENQKDIKLFCKKNKIKYTDGYYFYEKQLKYQSKIYIKNI